MLPDTTEVDDDFLSESPLGALSGHLQDPFTGALPTRREALSLVGAVLYAVRTQDGLIKIGWSDHLDTRAAHLPKAKLLAIKAGTRDDETALHQSLASHVHHGREWYNPTPVVMALVNHWRTGLGLDPVT